MKRSEQFAGISEAKRADWYKSLIFIGVYVAVISITSFILLVTYWYLWVALVAGGLIIILAWHAKSTVHHYPNCVNELEISGLTDFFSPHGVTKNGGWTYLKCPACSKRSKMETLVKKKCVGTRFACLSLGLHSWSKKRTASDIFT